MKTAIIAIFLLSFVYTNGQEQNIDSWIKEVDSLRQKHQLKIKEYPGKTFVGSLTGYYFNDSLVFINTLTDGEEAGIETLYYIKDGLLLKVLTLSAQFDSSGEWTKYFTKHNKNEKCQECHGQPKCLKQEVVFSSPVSVTYHSMNGERNASNSDNSQLIDEISRTYAGLLTLLQEL